MSMRLGLRIQLPLAWSPRGVPCYAERLGHFTERVSVVAAWCNGKVFAPMTPVTVIAVWLKLGLQVLVPKLRVDCHLRQRFVSPQG